MTRALLLSLLLLTACASQSSTVVGTPNPSPTPTPSQVSVPKTEWGQSVLSSSLRLVAGKPALLRVYAVGAQAGLSAALQGDVYLGNIFQDSLNFSGPTTFPLAQASTGDLSQTYQATLPASWVASGLEVRLYADASKSALLADLKPAVGTGTVLYMTMVPVLQPGQSTAPSIPSVSLIKDMLPVKDVQTTTRAPFTYGKTLAADGTNWGDLLSALANLRTTDGSNRYYYGLAKVSYSSGVAGIGYVGYPVALGWDYSSSAPRIMAHEVGHNLSMGHAPCGTTSGLESNWPTAYTNASIGTWGYSLSSGTLYSPSSYKDVMSYCNPIWISDYTYNKMQSYLETNSPQAQSLSAVQEVLLVSGRLSNGQLELNPLQVVQAMPSWPKPGPYTLRLQTGAGLQEIPFSTQVVEAPHGPGQDPSATWREEQFSFSIPNPGVIEGLEVRSAGRSLFQRAAGIQPQSLPSLSLSEQTGSLSLKWDNAVYPYASLAHLGRERTTLGLWLQGGQAQLSTQGLPSGGKFEVVLSDGLNSKRFEVAR